MSPRVFKEGDLVFWFHSYDVLWENQTSIHVGKGSQNDANDAKIWLEPQIEVAHAGRTLSRTELNLGRPNRPNFLDRFLAYSYLLYIQSG